MKRILTICLCLVMVLSVFAGCGEEKPETTQPTEHKHSYSKTWSSDENGHWYAADCGHEMKANQGEHLDENVDGTCDICAWLYTCAETETTEHVYDEEWTANETHHYHAATCAHYGAVSEKAEHVDENNDGVCDVCAYTGDHTHTFATEWSSDETQHWHAATCGHDVKSGLENHVDYNSDGVCDTCGWFDAAHTHTYGDEWVTNVVYHWHGATCEHTGAYADREEHADADGDKLCDTCGFEMCDHVDYDQDGQCDLCGWADPKHTHEFGEMASDKYSHWYVATCHPGATGNKEDHVDANTDGQCDICAFQICGHSFAAEWTNDDTHHWHAILCGCDVPRKDYAKHTLDENGVCTECMYGYVVKSAYEVILDSEPFTIVMDYMITWAEFKVNFPQPGRYVITVINPNGDQDIRISTTNSGEVDRNTDGFTLEVTEAGEMSLWFRVFDIQFTEGKEIPITYSVVRSDDLVIDTLKGKVELPTNTQYKLKFVAPEVGEYKLITSTEGLVIGLTEDSKEYFKGHISFTVSEVGEEFTFYIELNDLERQSFIFDWILEPPFCMNIADAGNYPVAVAPNQIDYKIEFVAPEAGYYSLSVDNQWLTFCYWNDAHKQPVRGNGEELEIQEVRTGWMEAGDVYTTWLQTVYNYPDSVDCRDTLTVTNIGEMVELGDSTLMPGAEGSKYTVTSNDTAYYCLSVENGEVGIISASGSITWTNYYEAKVIRGYSYSFMVRGEGEVKLNITTKNYEMTLEAGSNTILMQPAKEYDVSFGQYYLLNADGTPSETLANIDSNCKVKLSCSNPRVIIYVDGVQYQPGMEIELLHSTVIIQVFSNAEVEVELNVEVTNPKKIDEKLEGDVEATLEMNQQAKLLIEGSLKPATATFTATYGGTYVFKCSAATQVNVYIRSASGEETFVFECKNGAETSYEFQLEAGQSITFVVKVSSDTAVNAYAMISAK